ncbi:MAG: type IX secretion system PorP/SprF family membrane protein [Marivirga sp.]|jgi:type IX secretion system PorP/SprF family membrane protein
MKLAIKYCLSGILIFFVHCQLIGQQQVMYTQYMFNAMAINPAYAGSHDVLSMTALHRSQWLNIPGAPITQTFTAHMPIEEKNLGVGLLVMHDKIGVVNTTSTYGNFAYKIDFETKGTLSMGISAGINYLNANYSTVDPNDPSFANGDVRSVQPNVGVGVYYTTDKFFAGLSAPQILESTFNDTEGEGTQLSRHYFATTGYLFTINPIIKLKPQILIKYVEGAPVSFDLNASVLLKEMLWVGLSYRSMASLDGLIQFQLNNSFLLGYSYDFFTTSGLRGVNGGSHEIMLNYRLSLKKGTKLLSPIYF